MSLQPPPFKLSARPLTADGQFTDVWNRFLLRVQNIIDASVANGPFFIATANDNLTGATDLGLLTSGYLKIAVAAAIATPTAVSTIPGTDITHSVVSKTFADTGYVALADQTVLTNATGGGTTIKLPVTPRSGTLCAVKKTDASGNAVTIDGNGANIDGSSTKSLAAQFNARWMQFDGTNWQILGSV